jgi:hypothetical protein
VRYRTSAPRQCWPSLDHPRRQDCEAAAGPHMFSQKLDEPRADWLCPDCRHAARSESRRPDDRPSAWAVEATPDTEPDRKSDIMSQRDTLQGALNLVRRGYCPHVNAVDARGLTCRVLDP